MARGKSKEQAKIIPREIQALELRKAGFSYRDIGSKLGCSHEQARQDVMSELKSLAALRQHEAQELRELELERLDVLQKGLEPMAAVGNPQAVIAMLKVMERRSKLLGLDAPQQIEATVNDVSTLTDAERINRLAAIYDRARAVRSGLNPSLVSDD